MDAKQQQNLLAYSGRQINKTEAIWYLEAGGGIGTAYLLCWNVAKSLSKLVVNLLRTFPQRSIRGQ
jgi:hypothetical protein